MAVHRCKASFWVSHGRPMASYEVLVDGEKYLCNERQLDRLYDGVDPADLDLECISDSDPEEEGYQRAEAQWQHFVRHGL